MSHLSKSQIRTLDDTELQDIDHSGDLRDRIMSLLRLRIPFSDIFIYQDQPIMIKRQSELFYASDSFRAHSIVTESDIDQFFDAIEPDWQDILMKGESFDRSRNLGETRIRAHCSYSSNRTSKAIVIRRFPGEPLPLKSIGLSPQAQAFTAFDRGLILIIGDMCQGKSTTLASMLDDINQNRSGHILTIEDPIETIIPIRRCLITQREVGPFGDCTSFLEGTKAALRQQPNVIMIGEIRDEETALEAVIAAESGPLVIATIHAKSPESGIARMSRLLGGSSIQAEALSAVLKGVVYQVLIPNPNGIESHLACETITMNSTFSSFVASQDFGKIREALSGPQNHPGCHSLNTVLKQLILNKNIELKNALTASTDREKLQSDLRDKQ